MRKVGIVFFLIKIAVLANIFAGSATTKSMEIKGDFAKTKQCIRCHLDIYEEYKNSPHFNSTTKNDPIHKAVWEAYKSAKNAKKYVCGKCHTPTVKDLKLINSQKYEEEYNEAIACAYCHRIEAIKEHPKANENIILDKKGVYYGTRNPQIRSEYHKIINTNLIHKNGDTCMGCHSHKQNGNGFVVCKTDSNNTLEQNCITCHMPQVEGSLSDRVNTPTHAFHGFAGVKNNPKMLAKYVDLKVIPKNGYFLVEIFNHAPHDLLLHPMRTAKLIVEIYKGEKLIKRVEQMFERVIGKDGKPTPPWVADSVIKDSMIKAKEKRVVKIDEDIKGKRVVAKIGFYIVKPALAKKFNLEEFAKFTILKEVEFKRD